MTLIDRATSAKKTLIRISKIIRNSTTHDPESRRSETMRNIAQIIEESSNSIEIEKIVNQVDYFVKIDKDSMLKPSTIIEINDDGNFEIIR